MEPTQASSAPNGSTTPGDELNMPDLGNKWLKIRMANFLRLMQDNQKVLDTTNAEDRALRSQRHRLREAQTTRMAGGAGIQYPEDDMGGILIDSPTNHHYHQQPQPQQPFIGTLGKTLLAGALALGAGGIGYLANAFLNKPAAPAVTQPTNTTTTNREGFLIELIPATKDK